jgi:hypothetical protein
MTVGQTAKQTAERVIDHFALPVIASPSK